jgi:hypothetical protein
MANQFSSALRPVQQTVSVSEFRQGPSRCFQQGPVAVTKKGRTVGYLLSPELFENALGLLAETEDPRILKDELGLSDTWLQSLVSKD